MYHVTLLFIIPPSSPSAHVTAYFNLHELIGFNSVIEFLLHPHLFATTKGNL
jgi:hypothetical protein